MLQKSSMLLTAEIFFVYPAGKHNLMEISRHTGIAHTSIKKNLDELVKLGIISKSIEQKGKRKFPVYSANLENSLFKRYKFIHNISSILESGLTEFIDNKLTPRAIVLFGSYAKAEDMEESDIDIFVECEEAKLDLIVFEKKLGRKIQLHFNKDFSKYPKELKNNIINGIILKGFLVGWK